MYKYSRDIEDYTNIGLNADWCISTYPIGDCLIFDNEDDTYTLSIVDISYSTHEDSYNNLITGTFEMCIDYYELEERRQQFISKMDNKINTIEEEIKELRK